MFRSTHAFLRAGTLVLALTGAGAAFAGSGSTAGVPQKLVSSLQQGDYQAVDALLAKHPGVADKLLPDGSTPLSWAVETQDPLMVRRLLVAKARPDAATNPAASPLMLACEHGHTSILAMLLDAGADARRANAEGVTPLAACAGNASSDIVARLIDAGAAVDAADVRGQTPLMWAAANGRIENLRLLLAHGADINAQTKEGFSPLFFAIKSGKPAMSMAVLDAGGNPDHVGPENTNAAQLAIYQKDYAFALKMIERGVDLAALDRNGHTLLAAAVFENQPELVRALLARGADPNQWTGESKVEWRYEPNFRNGEYKAPSKHPLLIAAEKGSPEVMQLLVDAGAKTDVRMPDGTTVLHVAVSTGQLAPVEKALAIGIDPDVVDNGGRTALHRAVRLRPNFGFQTAEIVTALAKHGARADLRDERGKTAADLIEERSTDAVNAAFSAAFGTRTAQR